MSQPATAGRSTPTPYCSACGAQLPPSAPRCPRCGAASPAAGGRSRGPARVAAVILLAGILAVALIAAITVPGFLRFQVRSRSVVVKMQLSQIVQAEVRAAQEGGAFIPFAPFPGGELGRAERAFSAADRALARRLGWETEPASHGRFSVAVARGPSGVQAASFCAESDVDGDGARAVHVAFLPGLEDGELVLRPPPAPCTEPVAYSDEYDPGRVEKSSKEDVF